MSDLNTIRPFKYMINSQDYYEQQEFSEAIKIADELAFLITAGRFDKITEKHWEACLLIRNEQTQAKLKEVYDNK